MSALTFRITGDPASFKAAMGEVTKSMEGAGAKAMKVSQQMSALGNSLSIGITAPVIGAGIALVRTAADMEALRKGLDSVAKGSDTTEKQLARLKEVAKLPGLGFKEAIQGSVALQSAGLSANLAERSLKAFGNALAVVGRGKADLDGVSLALQQIATKTTFSAQEVNQLAERVPQIRKAMESAFGSSDTEKIQKMGISNIEIIQRLVVEMEKIKQVSGGTKNSLENLGDTVAVTADRLGQKLLPAVNDAISKLEPLIAKVGDLGDEFSKLPGPAQRAAVEMAAIALAAGPMLSIGGKLITVLPKVGTGFAAISTAMLAFKGLKEIAGNLEAAGTASRAWIDSFNEANKPVSDLIKSLTDKLSPAVKDLILNFDDWKVKLFTVSPAIAGVEKATELLGEGIARLQGKTLDSIKAEIAHEKHQRRVEQGFIDEAAATEKSAAAGQSHATALNATSTAMAGAAKTSESLKLPTMEILALFEMSARAAAQKSKDVETLTTIMGHYGVVTARAAEKAAKALNLLFISYRQLSDAPDIPTPGLRFGDIPKFKEPPVPLDSKFMKTGGKSTALSNVMGGWSDDIEEKFKNSSKAARRAMQQVSTIATDLSRNVSSAGIGLIFNRASVDVSKFKEEIAQAEAEYAKLLEGQKKGHVTAAQLTAAQNKLADANRRMGEEAKKAAFGFQAFEAAKAMVSSLAQSITRVLIEGALEELGKKLLKVSGIMGKVFSTSASVGESLVPALNPVINAAGGFGAQAAKTGGAVASAGATAMVSAVTGVISAISGVIGNFQFMAMNKSLDIIVKHTLQTANDLSNLRADEWLREGHLFLKLDDIWNSIRVGSGGSGTTVINNNNMAGAYLLSDATMDDFITAIARKLKQQGL